MDLRQRFWQFLLVLPLVILMQIRANAKILLPQILSSNMVLQRDKPINIWGFASPGEKVSVSFANQTRSATADAKGNWLVILKPLKTSNVGQNLTIVGTNKIVLTNILVGEVWLCSGQSNMEYAMRKLAKIARPKNEKFGFPQNEVETANNDNIRIFLVNRKQLSKPDSIHKSWSVAKDSALRAFSVVGYFFAKELQQKLGVPVGIIESAVSGSAIEPWIDPKAFAKEAFFSNTKVRNDPGKFFIPMIEPLSLLKIRGFLWYQGETNCFLNEDISYAYKMKTLINSWRQAWNDGDLPFYYVQIAPYNYSKHSDKEPLNADTQPRFWEAQAQLLRLPHTGMVVTTDLNDNQEDLHPGYKWEIGRRLSLWALANNYGQQISYTGPTFQSVQFMDYGAYVSFKNARKVSNTSGTMYFDGFELAGADGKFYPARASTNINNSSQVVVTCKMVEKPTRLRYNWSETPIGTLIDSDSKLPAMPFRTDNSLANQFKVSHN